MHGMPEQGWLDAVSHITALQGASACAKRAERVHTRHAIYGQAGPAAQAAVPLGGPLLLIAHHVVRVLPALSLHRSHSL